MHRLCNNDEAKALEIGRNCGETSKSATWLVSNDGSCCVHQHTLDAYIVVRPYPARHAIAQFANTDFYSKA
jgi:hypothetical protein